MNNPIDTERRNALIREDGVLIPPRLAGWIVRLIEIDLAARRRRMNGNYRDGDDILETIDALRKVDADPSLIGHASDEFDRIVNEVEGSISCTHAANSFGCSPRHIRRFLVSGELRGCKVGRTWVIDLKDFEEFRFKKATSEHGR